MTAPNNRRILWCRWLVLGWVVGLGILGAAADEAPPRLEGVPERVVGQIIDVTAVYAERTFSTPTEQPELIPYLAVQPKERPWRFPLTRPGHRRVLESPHPATASVATGRSEIAAPGQGRYTLRLSLGQPPWQGGLLAFGRVRGNTFTQGRGTGALLSQGGFLRRETLTTRFLAAGEYRWERTHWLQGGTTPPEPLSHNRSLLTAWTALSQRSPSPFGVRWKTFLQAAALEGRWEPDGAEGEQLQEVTGRVRLDWQWGVAPTALTAQAHLRQTQEPGQVPRTTATLALGWQDRGFDLPFGRIDWKIAGMVFREPGSQSAQTGWDLPLRLAWTGALGERTFLRAVVERKVELFPLNRLLDREFVVISAVPLRRGWVVRTGAAWSRARTVIEAEVRLVRYQREWAWIEQEDTFGNGSNVPSWRADALRAAGVLATLRMQYRRGPVVLLGQIVWDGVQPSSASGGDHLPYRPRFRGDLWLAWTPTPQWQLIGALELRSRRYTTLERKSSPKPFPERGSLEPYARIRIDVERRLSPQVALYLLGEASVGDFQRFQAQRLPEAYRLNQNAIGAGLRIRL